VDSASPLTVDNLLDHGSLARDVSEDPALLDIDSDSDTCEGSTVTMPMTLDNDNDLNITIRQTSRTSVPSMQDCEMDIVC
jgi:hypothetical protein